MDIRCTMEGCGNLRMANGQGGRGPLCTKHHKHNMLYANSSDKRRKRLANDSCTVCGWNQTPCDRHRLLTGKNGGKYISVNIMVLCPNHHRLLHLVPTNPLPQGGI